ncbi:META domain-containing protein [Cruoricaptor ignavus]|uniref:META domain-containing protein n=1 Tax=Cruoricaptor ignavus TaxID=1118202 RepID=A0A7M1T342_9FLAO|nr:META domain-containing protein [Cruoricaptor ignavus]QOR74161.1 META domain-containing protein [Cruoricaptor ignavus]
MKKLAIVAVSFFLVSCGTATTASSSKTSAQPSLANSSWYLAEKVKGKTPTIAFQDGKISGNAQCNNYFADVNLDDSTGAFKSGVIGATKMSCDQIAAENTFLSMLQEADRYAVHGNTLELYKGNLLLLKFTKQ